MRRVSELGSRGLIHVRNAAKSSGVWQSLLGPRDLVQRCAQDVSALITSETLTPEAVASLGANAVTAAHRTAPSFESTLYSAKQTTGMAWTTDAQWLQEVRLLEAQLRAEEPDPAVLASLAVLADAWLERQQPS